MQTNLKLQKPFSDGLFNSKPLTKESVMIDLVNEINHCKNRIRTHKGNYTKLKKMLSKREYLTPNQLISVDSFWKQNGHFNSSLYRKFLDVIEGNITYKRSGVVIPKVPLKTINPFPTKVVSEWDYKHDCFIQPIKK